MKLFYFTERFEKKGFFILENGIYDDVVEKRGSIKCTLYSKNHVSNAFEETWIELVIMSYRKV